MDIMKEVVVFDPVYINKNDYVFLRWEGSPVSYIIGVVKEVDNGKLSVLTTEGESYVYAQDLKSRKVTLLKHISARKIRNDSLNRNA
ncbi:shikimate dehydrogenase-like protein [Bacillus phage Shbh1]|uniref:Shikimate dehydrogenase-like protein n=1 Tax=Bacillus phage Shbh1 TaxID=1796992 RepID=A0A142F160_9CAUD|nr:shikimate dehydrogenase-like protein [Bacillus phage Shbh1]AMQ66517.1 shikimate dehydrogenase-like protein [Bacillus phage Shbh1]